MCLCDFEKERKIDVNYTVCPLKYRLYGLIHTNIDSDICILACGKFDGEFEANLKNEKILRCSNSLKFV
ncbi:hypothetical protein L6452_17728 [Arctium lappa]|uniref:Uncharacterized protein n=1 Tax=Arctium lappa TaxID=4217 RepID=A0ACB9C4E8_ARCLA|nr:hypothetical protein L6452_17728 [Arctium lappa]